MKTAFTQYIEWLKIDKTSRETTKEILQRFLDLEKNQIKSAFAHGYLKTESAEDYFNNTYNENSFVLPVEE